MEIFSFINKLRNQVNLSVEESRSLIEMMMQGTLLDAQIAACLMAWEIKGITYQELLGAVLAMRGEMVEIPCSNPHSIDVVGTGGDGYHTFNISTATALVASACGVTVAKHGNRGVTSKSGSADVLSHLGFNLNLSPSRMRSLLEEESFCFFFAPLVHPAMKNVANARQALKIRTIFNFLGPLANPAAVKRGLYGACDYDMLKIMAQVALELDFQSAFFVYGDGGVDELSLTGADNKIIEIKNGEINNYNINPKDYGFEFIKLNKILGDSPKKNAEKLLNLIKGEDSEFKETVIFNSGFALYSSGLFSNLNDCFVKARKVLDSKEVFNKFNSLIAGSNK